MRQSELDPLISSVSFENYSTYSKSLRERRSGKFTPSPPTLERQSPMHYPQHKLDRGEGHDSKAAVATRGPSRQLFYRDRIPQLPSELRENTRNISMASSDSSDSSVENYNANKQQSRHRLDNITFDGTRFGAPGILPQQHSSQMFIEPSQLHADFRDQRYKSRLAGADPSIEERYREKSGGALIEVSEEVYAVRKAALTVLDPITYCWLILTAGFSVSVALGASKWTGKFENIPIWLIFLPAWISHLGILSMHVLSAKALSKFIAEANENRQRTDSTDHLDRIEYLPLLQRSLKFVLKTGVLCFVLFVFEVLLLIRLYDPKVISLTATYVPFWILTLGFISNGIICKSQHFINLLVWVLVFTAMVLSVLKIDYGIYQIMTSHIIIVIQSMLALISASLVYVINGHQIGYFKLTDSQMTAGVFYATSSFLAMILVAIIGETFSLPELIQLDFQLITIVLSPIVITLVGIGAWCVTCDEFERLLKYGGQSAVIPMKLRLETNGWTSVESKGITSMPMFGDVRYEPLDQKTVERLSVELCWSCCSTCYPAEDDEDLPHQQGRNNYQSPTPPMTMAVSARWGGGETIV